MDTLKIFWMSTTFAISAAVLAPATALAQGTGNGLIAEYYNTNNFTGAVAVTQTNQGPISFAYGNAAPTVGVNVDNFSIRWRGEIEAPSTEIYTFYTTQDDQSRLYINGNLLLTNTAVNVENTVTFSMTAGQRYAFMLEFIEFGGGAGVTLSWSSPITTAKVLVPLTRFYSPAALPAPPTFTPNGGTLPLSVTMTAPTAGTTVRYTLDGSDPGIAVPGTNAVAYSGPVLLTQSYLRINARAYGPLGTPSNMSTSNVFTPLMDPVTLPATTVPGIYARYYHLNNPQVVPNYDPLYPQRRAIIANFGITLTPARDRGDGFGFKETGFVNIPAEGLWTFTASSDDGSKLYIGGHEVVNNDGLHGAPGPNPTGSIALKAGWHPITVTMFENGGGEALGVQWQGPGVPAAVAIPDANLATQPAALAPTATPAGSTFAASQLVTLNVATPGASIYYTLDGSAPDPRLAGSVGLNGLSFTVTQTTRVRAVAIAPNLHPSDILDVTFAKTIPTGPRYAAVTAAGIATQAIVEFDRPVNLTGAAVAGNYALNNGATVSAAVPLTKASTQRAYWKLDDAGPTAADSSGNLNVGNFIGGPTPDVVNFATLPFGNASSLAFDGVDDLVQVPNSASLDLADRNFTISLWVRPSTTGTAQALINHYTTPTSERGWRVDINSATGGALAAGNVWVRLRDGTDTAEVSFAAGLTAGVWQHLAIRVDRARNRFTLIRTGGAPSVNLVNTFTTNVRRRIDMTPLPLQLGAMPNPAGTANERFFSGNMDDVRIYGCALSDDEMRALAAGHDTFATTVRLTTSALNPATVYTLTTSNVQDLAGAAIDASVAGRTFRYYAAGTIASEQFAFDLNGNGIGGGRVPDLVLNAAFPGSPSGASLPTLFETPTNILENYGGRVRGWLIPSATGWYRLSLATDDGGALFVSPNEDPTNKMLQSFCWEWTAVRTYVDAEVSQSPAMNLTAGQKYYVELFFKEGGGGDNAAVAMIPLTGPTDVTQVANATAPIAGALLAPYVEPPSISQQPTSVLLMPGQPLLLTVGVGSSGPRTFQWQKNGAPIAGATTFRLSIPAVTAADAATYTVVIASGGDSVTSAAAIVNVVVPPAPTLTAAAPPAGPHYGAQSVLLTGSNLLFDVTTLQFGGTNTTNAFYYADGQTAIVRSPPHAAGQVNLVAITPGGSGTATGAYTYYAPPTLTAVAPQDGPIAGGQTVTLTGTNFVPLQTQVQFDGIAATSVNVISATSLTAVTPAHAAGQVSATVTTTFGTTTLAAAYTYFDPPTLSLVAPADGPLVGGQAVVLTGTNFVSGKTTVSFDATLVPIGAFSPTQLSVVTPAHAAGAVTVMVTTPGGPATATYTYHNPPTISQVSPAAGPVGGGQAVTITGTNFVSGLTTATFGGAAATVGPTSATTCDLTTPPHAAGLVSVVVVTPGGSVTALSAYRYHVPPTLGSVLPFSGPSTGGQILSLGGTNFVPGQTSVSFGLDPGSGVSVAPDGLSLTVVTPIHAAGAVNVTVTTPGGNAAAAGAYTYHDAPTAASANPATGTTQGGQMITITGTNFVIGQTTVSFGGVAAPYVNVTDPTSLTATSPAHATGPVDVVVVTPGGTGTALAAYSYSGPYIGSVTPVAGPLAGGQSVTLGGTGFVPGSTTIALDGVNVAIGAITATSVTFTSPPGAAAGGVDVSITTPDGSFVAVDGYFYVGFPSISGVAPSRGPVVGGATLTITGSDFAPGNTVVNVGGVQAVISTITVSQIVVVTPAHAPGLVDVVVTTFGNQSATSLGAYTYIDPPVVSSIAPNRGPTTGGQTVVIRGLRFEPGATSVAIGGAPAGSVLVDPGGTMLTAVTGPRSAGLVDVVVTTFGLQSGTRPAGYTYVDPATAADLALTMSVNDSTPSLLQEVAFTLSLSNSGQLAAAGVQVTDLLPPGLVFVSATMTQGSYDPVTGIWNVGGLASLAGATLSLVARVDSTAPLLNAAEVTASGTPDLDSTPANGIPEEDDRAEISLTAALEILTDPLLPSATSGALYARRLLASGGNPPYLWSFVSGQLPLNFDPRTGDLQGIAPVVVASTDFSFTLSLTDDQVPPASVLRTFTLTVHPLNSAAPAMTSTSPAPTGFVGAAFSHIYTAVDGTPPYTWQVTVGPLPPGLSLNRRSGKLAGAPTAAGSFAFTLQVTDATGVSTTGPATVNVFLNPPVLAPTGLVAGSSGSFYAQPLQVTGGVGPTFTWTISAGALPGGLALAGTGRFAEISGSPSAAGSFAFTVRAADGGQAGVAAVRNYTLQIAGPGGSLVVTPQPLPPGTLGVPYSARFTSTGGSGPPAWSLDAGTLPPGLSLAPATGIVSGTPGADGVFRLLVRAGPGASAAFDLYIAPTPVIVTPGTLPTAVFGEAYDLEFRAMGGVPPYRWTLVGGALPAGLTLNGSAGTLQGITTGVGASFTLEARDARGAIDTAAFLLNIVDPAAGLSVLSSALRRGEVGTPYGEAVAAGGGTPPYQWTLATGALPGWAALEGTTGALSGLPDVAGITLFAIGVGDSAAPTPGSSTSGTLTLEILDRLLVSTASLPDAVELTPYTQVLAVTGAAAPLQWRILSGALPEGFSLGASTGQISGSGSVLGTRSFRVEATDAAGRRATRTLSITTQRLQAEGNGGRECAVGAASGLFGGWGWIVAAAALGAFARGRRPIRKEAP